MSAVTSHDSTSTTPCGVAQSAITLLPLHVRACSLHSLVLAAPYTRVNSILTPGRTLSHDTIPPSHPHPCRSHVLFITPRYVIPPALVFLPNSLYHLILPSLSPVTSDVSPCRSRHTTLGAFPAPLSICPATGCMRPPPKDASNQGKPDPLSGHNLTNPSYAHRLLQLHAAYDFTLYEVIRPSPPRFLGFNLRFPRFECPRTYDELPICSMERNMPARLVAALRPLNSIHSSCWNPYGIRKIIKSTMLFVHDTRAPPNQHPQTRTFYDRCWSLPQECVPPNMQNIDWNFPPFAIRAVSCHSIVEPCTVHLVPSTAYPVNIITTKCLNHVSSKVREITIAAQLQIHLAYSNSSLLARFAYPCHERITQPLPDPLSPLNHARKRTHAFIPIPCPTRMISPISGFLSGPLSHTMLVRKLPLSSNIPLNGDVPFDTLDRIQHRVRRTSANAKFDRQSSFIDTADSLSVFSHSVLPLISLASVW
ncbi:hypothetical protein AG1IA_00693 [Rhizoctonia solani AG-1 IA]|uniref:Uncharacterized protein n=1 Tax=Thanatephorus cucumeris (strain AG1-IA) TaxID=983506 RepID=L8X4T5_THACA|nr:hypothetical protein AG1IA_00693 [Rhizoctonia solani AG-1 IA]